MDTTRKKQLLKPMLFLIISLILYAADMLYSNQTAKEEVINQTSVQEKPIPLDVTPQSSPTVILKPVVPIQVASPLDTIPSPFALLTEAIATTVPGANPLGTPMITLTNSAILPIFPSGSGFNAPAFSTILAPGRDVVLKAILYKPGEINMAILDDGTNEVIAVEGKQTEWGFVSEITQHTVTLDDVILTLAKPESNQRNNKNRASAAPIMQPSLFPNH